ncbi:MAG: BofC C-terminal domain-containing protein [Bacillota bacterium]|nr:BofC C-terminal domain-containing protein [Bacillota bacterium]
MSIGKFAGAAVSLFAAGLIVGTTATTLKGNVSMPVQQKSNQEIQVSYIVRMEDGNVNVYEKNGGEETFKKSIKNVNTFDLPDKTLNELKGGIYVKDTHGLEKIIEEITS